MIGLLEINRFFLCGFISVSYTTECFVVLVISSQSENVYFPIGSFALTIKVLVFVRFPLSVALGRAEVGHRTVTPSTLPLVLSMWVSLGHLITPLKG